MEIANASGTIVDTRYQLIEHLGEGSSGSTYSAVRLEDGSIVAIKIIRNDDGRVFLVDFGAVQDVYNNTLLKGSTVAGTFGYMAPEQFRSLAVPASDLYGLGATILYLLTHRSPADLPQERLKRSFRAHVNISDRFADWLETIMRSGTMT